MNLETKKTFAARMFFLLAMITLSGVIWLITAQVYEHKIDERYSWLPYSVTLAFMCPTAAIWFWASWRINQGIPTPHLRSVWQLTVLILSFPLPYLLTRWDFGWSIMAFWPVWWLATAAIVSDVTFKWLLADISVDGKKT